MTDDQFADLKAEVTAARAAAEQAVRGIAMLVLHLGAAPRPVVDVGGRIASDEEIDRSTGDPEVKMDPKQWVRDGGESFKGRHLSECPPAFLDLLAEANDYSAQKDRDKAVGLTGAERVTVLKWVPANERTAALARGWARRKRAAPEAPATTEQVDL